MLKVNKTKYFASQVNQDNSSLTRQSSQIEQGQLNQANLTNKNILQVDNLILLPQNFSV